jgi:hypothetical protein
VDEWQHLEADNELKEVIQRENEGKKESESPVTSQSKSCGEPSPKKPHIGDLMPFDVKIKAVTLVQLHPHGQCR